MHDIIPFNELKDLAGRKKPSLVIAWLRDNGVPFLIARNGYPKVHRLALAARMGAPVSAKEDESDDGAIDFSSLGG